MPQWIFCMYNGFSGFSIYDEWFLTMYNMFFTAGPLMFKALFDYDICYQLDGDEYRGYMPDLYYVGQRSLIFNEK
jgi:magnesium-transporting ATPase (P-type)